MEEVIRLGSSKRGEQRRQRILVALLGGRQYCGDGGESRCAPRRPKAATYFAMDHRLAQCPLAGVVIGRHIGAVQEGEQSIAMLQIALGQALTVTGTNRYG